MEINDFENNIEKVINNFNKLNISNDDIISNQLEKIKFKILRNYFNNNGIVKHQIDTFNDFLNNGIKRIIQENDIYINNKDHYYHLSFDEVYIPYPTIMDENRNNRILFPDEARTRDLTYDSPIFVNIKETYKYDDEKEEYNEYKRILIARIPIMLNSSKCNLTKLTKSEKISKNECEWDSGGYFIIKGKERVLIGQIRGNYNQPIVIKQRANDKYIYICETRSMSEETGHSVLIQSKIINDERTIVFNLPNIKEPILAGIVLKAFGFITEKEIKDIIGYCDNDKYNKIIKFIWRDSYFITSRDEALKYIGQYSLHTIKEERYYNYALQIIENELLPHMGISSSNKEKAYFLGNMLNKLIKTFCGLRKEDDRDNYINKRVEMAGVLCFDLTRALFKRFLKSIQSQLEKKKQYPDIVNIISRISSITLGLRYAFACGAWGVQKNNYVRTGVSQVLSRMTHGAVLSHLRRVVIPVGREGKNAKIRQLHPSQLMFICPCECFDPLTPILLWNGNIKLAKDIDIGDILIDDRGQPTVVNKTISGVSKMYEIIPEKNNFMKYKVTSNHILTLKIKNHKRIRKSKRQKYEVHWFDIKIMKHISKVFDTFEDACVFNKTILFDGIIDISIEYYLNLPIKEQKQMYLFKSNNIDWKKKEVLIDPYILGMWLGDGLKTGWGFVSADDELIDYWKKWGEQNDIQIKQNKKYQYSFSSIINNNQIEQEDLKPEKAPFRNMLNKYNLIDNKHIPNEYLVNSRDVRLQLLAGIIDTDGNVRANGHEVRICQGPSNFHIIDQLYILSQSLGFSCHVNIGTNQWTHTDKNGNKQKRYSTYKELTLTGQYLYEIPTKLKRKKLNKFESNITITRCDSFLQSSFNLCEEDIGEFVGWQLDGNGRFLLSDFSITHNTPEGQSIGIVLNLALMTTVSLKIPTVLVKQIIEKSEFLITIDNIQLCENYPKVFLNGVLMGITLYPDKFIEDLKFYRNINLLHKHISFSYDYDENEVKIYCDEGRLIRPVLTINKNNKLNLDINNDNILWDNLVEQNKIQYVDHNEIQNAVIAMDENDLLKFKCDFCEIHPSMMLGVMANSIPFSDHTQSPRNIYQCLDINTTVLLTNGNKIKIKDIKVGDKVVTFNPKTLKLTKTKVIHQYIRPTQNKIFQITTLSGRTIIATSNHNFMTDKGWNSVKDMLVNKQIKIGILSDYEIIEDGLIDEYWRYLKFCYSLEIKSQTNINTLSFNDWSKIIKIKNTSMFMPIHSITEVSNRLIADITVESENHSFIAGENFLSSNSSMGKQSVGIHALSHQTRSDTITHILDYPQKPLVNTIPADILGFNDMPTGINAIVAVMTYGGFGQEDAIIMNKASIERGLFSSSSYRTIVDEEKKHGMNSYDTICLPNINIRQKHLNYSLLDQNGIIKNEKKGKLIHLEKGDVVIGKVMTKTSKTGEVEYKDCSYYIKSGEEGYLDRIFITTTVQGHKMIKIVIRNHLIPEVGDKFCMRSAQKGVVGAIVNQEDMPFTESGIVPDVIMNAHALPSRMTINLLLEMILGKSGVLKGKFQDSTPFTKQSSNIADNIEKILENSGFNIYGWEAMYSGHTGEMTNAKIYIAPGYYYRLKHMVKAKIHSRSHGSVTSTTRQPYCIGQVILQNIASLLVFYRRHIQIAGISC